MIQDHELDQLLCSYDPTLSSTEQFLKTLDQRLKAIDILKQYNAEEMHRNRRRAATSFCIGAVCGAVSAILLLLVPDPIEMLQITIHSQILAILLSCAPYLFIATSIALIIYGMLIFQTSIVCE